MLLAFAEDFAAIDGLWSVLFRPPTVDEIAVETGVTPEAAEKLAYKYGTQRGWFNPKPQLMKESAEKLGEILVCATRMRDGAVQEDGSSKDFNYQGDMEIVEGANKFLKEQPKMLPTRTQEKERGEVLSWSPEGLKYVGNYKPTNRIFAFFKFG